MDEVSLAKSWIYSQHASMWFFVSTIERDSSAMVSPPPRFAETIGWIWMPKPKGEDVRFPIDGERTTIVYTDGDGPSWLQHSRACEMLMRYGVFWEKELAQ